MAPNPPESHVPVRNNTKMTIFVAGTMIPAGETRILPAHQVPENLRPVKHEEAEPRPDPVLSLLDNPVKDIVPELGRLTDPELANLKTAEVNGNTRKSLLSAIAEEELQRAAAKADALHAQEDVAAVIASIPGLSDLELNELATKEEGAENAESRAAVIEAIAADFARRDKALEDAV